MKLYHMSQSLRLGDTLTPDFKGCKALVQPFVQAMEKSADCFYGMVLNGKYLFAVMNKSNLRMWANYAKWATEAVFEYIRKTEFPHCCSRISSNYFYDNLPDCKKLYAYDWAEESEEERQKVHLFEIDLTDDAPQRRDMNIFDAAYDAMDDRQDVTAVIACARRYFNGEHTENPVWEILSDKQAKAVRDVTEYLKG